MRFWPKYFRMRARAADDGRVEPNTAREVALGFLALEQSLDAPAIRRPESDAAAERHTETDVALVVPDLDAAGDAEDFDGLGGSQNGSKDDDGDE